MLGFLKDKIKSFVFEEDYVPKVEFSPTIYPISKISKCKNWWNYSLFLKGLEKPLVIYRDDETLNFGWGYLNSIDDLKSAVRVHANTIGGVTFKKNSFSEQLVGYRWWSGVEALSLVLGLFEGTFRNISLLKELTLPSWSGYLIIEPLNKEEEDKLLKELEKSVKIASKLEKEGYRHESEIGIDTLRQVQRINVTAENVHRVKSALFHSIKNSGKAFRVYMFGNFANVPGAKLTNEPQPSYVDCVSLSYLTYPPMYVDKLPNPEFRIPNGIENGDIHLGWIWQRGCVYDGSFYPKKGVYFLSKNLARHLGVFGKTGSGKTNALEYIVYQLQNIDDYHIVVFDKEGQYCGWKDKDGVIGDFEVIDVYYDIHYQINLFDVFFDAGLEEIMYLDVLKQKKLGLATPDTLDIPMETFISIYKTLSVITGDEVGSTQIGILRALYREWLSTLYQDFGGEYSDLPVTLAKRELLRKHGLDSFIQFIKTVDIESVLNTKVGFNITDAYVKVVNKLEELKVKAPFLCANKTTIDIEKLMQKNFILNLFNLYNKTNSLFAMGMVAYAYMALIWSYHRQHPPESGQKPTILIIDEAQNYAPSSQYIGGLKSGIKKLLLSTIMEEGRKWGVWVVCAAPTLVGLDEAIRRQPGSYLFFQFTEADEKEAVFHLIGDRELLEDFDIGDLPLGHCISRILIKDESGITSTSPPFGMYVPYAGKYVKRREYPYDAIERREIINTSFLKEEYLEYFKDIKTDISKKKVSEVERDFWVLNKEDNTLFNEKDLPVEGEWLSQIIFKDKAGNFYLLLDSTKLNSPLIKSIHKVLYNQYNVSHIKAFYPKGHQAFAETLQNLLSEWFEKVELIPLVVHTPQTKSLTSLTMVNTSDNKDKDKETKEEDKDEKKTETAAKTFNFSMVKKILGKKQNSEDETKKEDNNN